MFFNKIAIFSFFVVLNCFCVERNDSENINLSIQVKPKKINRKKIRYYKDDLTKWEITIISALALFTGFGFGAVLDYFTRPLVLWPYPQDILYPKIEDFYQKIDVKFGSYQDRQCAILIGLACGDALGAPWENILRQTYWEKKAICDLMISAFRNNGCAGDWTDDTSQALALLDALNNYSTNEDLRVKFLEQLYLWGYNGKYVCFGKSDNPGFIRQITARGIGRIGSKTLLEKLLAHYDKHKTFTNFSFPGINAGVIGNATIMRAGVVLLKTSDCNEAMNLAEIQTRATNDCDENAAFGRFFIWFLHQALHSDGDDIARKKDLFQKILCYQDSKYPNDLIIQDYVKPMVQVFWNLWETNGMDEVELLRLKYFDEMCDTRFTFSELIFGKKYSRTDFGHNSKIPPIGSMRFTNFKEGFFLPPAATCAPTFICALWAFLIGNNINEVILEAVRLLGDADTIAAVAGQIAGAFWGAKDLNPHWFVVLGGLGSKQQNDNRSILFKLIENALQQKLT